jgi:outer membrane protein
MKIYRNIFLWASMSLALVNLQAQDKLSLSDAIQLGLVRNYDIQIQQKTVDIATNNNNWGEAGRYPSINLNLNQNNGINDNVKTASPFQLQDITISNSINPGVNLNWTLFNGFQVNITKRRLEQLQAESQGNASIVISNTIQAIILGYYRATLENRRLEEFRKQLTLSRDRLEYLQLKSEIGSAVSADLLVIEGNYLTDSLNLINQQLVYRNALRDLNVLLVEVDLDKQYDLTDDLNSDIPDYAYEDLRAKQLNQNVDLKKQFISQTIASSNLGLAKASRYPSLQLSMGVSESRSRVDLSQASFPNGDGTFSSGPTDPLTAITDSYSANFSLSFTLFNGGKINRAIKNAVIQEDIANIQIDQLTFTLDRNLRQALDLYQIRQQTYAINERREQVARTNLELSEQKFVNGSINSFDYRVVQNNYLSAAILKLQAMYNLMDSHVSLMRLTGGLIETYQ